MMAKIYSPNKEYVGESAGVGFIRGVGETDDANKIEWFRNNGYTVDEPAPDPVEQPQLDGADTNKNPLLPDTGSNPRVAEMATSDAAVKLNPNPPTAALPMTGVQAELLIAAANNERDEIRKKLEDALAGAKVMDESFTRREAEYFQKQTALETSASEARDAAAKAGETARQASLKVATLEKENDSLKKQLADAKKKAADTAKSTSTEVQA